MDNALKLPVATRSPETALTALQERFVEHWLRYRNATQAYKFASEAAECAYFTAANEGQKLLRDERVQAAIKARAHEAFKDTTADVGWILQRYVDIATADPRELIGLKIGCCRYCHGEGHGYQWREREYLEACDKVEQEIARQRTQGRGRVLPVVVDLAYPDVGGGFGYNATLEPHPDCPQCHGEGVERFVPRDTDKLSDQALLLYGGVKVRRDGYEIIIADRSKALEMAGKIMGAFTERLDVNMRGSLAALVAVGDLRKVDPAEAAKVYRDMIAGNLSA